MEAPISASMVADCLEGRRVLVTGHTGFKGAWLTAWLRHLGAEVVGLSDRRYEEGAYVDLRISEGTEEHQADVRDFAAVDRIVQDARPSMVFHLAAQPIVRAGWLDRRTTFETNVMGTVNVVEASLAQPSVDAVVVVTTDKVYENANNGTYFVETDPLGGHDPYSASKAAAELVLAPYRDAAHMGLRPRPVVSARAGNVIGGGDRAPDRLVPDLIRAFEAGEPVTLRRPDAVRPWQHVLDCLKGYLVLATAVLDGRRTADSYNFAHTASERTVLEIAREVADRWGASSSSIQVERDDSTAEATLLQLDAGRAAADLGWTPRWTVEESVRRTVEFYKASDKIDVARAHFRAHME